MIKLVKYSELPMMTSGPRRGVPSSSAADCLVLGVRVDQEGVSMDVLSERVFDGLA